MIKAPFMIYADFESILVPEDDGKQSPEESYTIKYQKHVTCSCLRFQIFSFASKKVQGFSNDRKILMSLLSVLFHLPNRISVF